MKLVLKQFSLAMAVLFTLSLTGYAHGKHHNHGVITEKPIPDNTILVLVEDSQTHTSKIAKARIRKDHSHQITLSKARIIKNSATSSSATSSVAMESAFFCFKCSCDILGMVPLMSHWILCGEVLGCYTHSGGCMG